MTDEYTPEQQEAADVRDTAIDFATEHGWTVKRRGMNKTWAFAELEPAKDQALENLQLFYAIEGSDKEDRFLWGPFTVGFDDLRDIISADSPRRKIDAVKSSATQKRLLDLREERLTAASRQGVASASEGYPVPPTGAAHGAAHTAAVPPMVPPTVQEAQRAAHTAASAAHSAADAAHTADVVPPTSAVDRSVDKHVDVLKADAAHMAANLGIPAEVMVEAVEATRDEVAAEAGKHLQSAGKVSSVKGTMAAVEHQLGQNRNWSPIASVLSTAELLAGLPGKTVKWRNRLSNQVEEALVSSANDSAGYPLKITPPDFDVESFGEDMRVLHFVSGGTSRMYRSVAVSAIVDIA